jgi:transposase
MIALQSDVRVYLACGYTDMRKSMQGLAMLVQQVLAEDPFNGALNAFRGRRGNLLKLSGMTVSAMHADQAVGAWSFYLTDDEHRPDRVVGGAIVTLLEGCEWRAAARNLRPELAG